MTTTEDPRPENIAAAYRAMATRAHYRPAADVDRLTGGAPPPLHELDLDAEAKQYAEHWLAAEDSDMTFWVGCTDFELARATIYALEAARCLCAGVFGIRIAQRLLRMALAELTPERLRVADALMEATYR